MVGLALFEANFAQQVSTLFRGVGAERISNLGEDLFVLLARKFLHVVNEDLHLRVGDCF